jgi:hypothetical protein
MGPAPLAAAPGDLPSAEQRALGKLSDDLQVVDSLASKKEWGNLHQHIERAFPQQQRLPGELRAAIDGVEARGEQLRMLNGLDEQLASGKTPILSEVEEKSLPQPLREALGELSSLERLKADLSAKWVRKPDLSRLKSDLAIFAAATGDSAKGRQLQDALAAKAFHEDYTDEAEKLLPSGRSLRDLEKSLPTEGIGGSAADKAPSANRFDGFAPEPPSGTAAGPRHSAKEGLPRLEEELKTDANKARQRARKLSRDQIEVASHQLSIHLHVIQDYGQRADQLSKKKDEDRKTPPGHAGNLESAIAKALKRPLTPQDRILLKGMQNRGMNPAQIVAQFRDLETAASK